MFYTSDFCCICLCNQKDLVNMTDSNNETMSYYSQLISSVQGMYWKEMDVQRLICKQCTNDVDFVHTFHQKCLESAAKLIDYLSHLQTVNKLKDEITIHLTDITEYNKNKIVKIEHEVEDNVEDVIDLYTDNSEKSITNENVKKASNIPDICQVNIKMEIPDADFNNKEEEIKEDIENSYDTVKEEFTLTPPKTNEILSVCVDLNEDKNEEEETTKYTGSSNGRILEEILHKSKKENQKAKFQQCKICGRRVVRHLARHMRTHTGERPHVCDICGERFIQRTSLLLHIRNHTEKKPYKCTMCGKRFTLKSHRNLHMDLHTEDKPYNCDICGRKYTRKSNLNRHIQIHLGNKPHGCNVCSKKFTRKFNLNQHMLTHAKESLNDCNDSDKESLLSTHKIEHSDMLT